jgi:DnaA family protein
MSSDARQLPLDIKLRDDATVANYIGEAGYRLLGTHGIVYLWGEPGSGRSHLLQAACHHARGQEKSAIYLAEPAGHAAEMLRDLDRLDLVCIDDLQQVAGDPEWETALFHLLNSVRGSGGTLVVSADRSIQRLAIRLPDLKSRLLAAHAIETDRLDDTGKLELMKQKASRQGFRLADDVGRFIMSRSDRDVRSLVDLLARLEVETLRQQKRVTIPFVKQVLEL